MGKKKKPDHGIRTKAGQLLSQFVRSIALEQTELIKVTDGEDRMASKAEALARLMWQRALGYVEQRVEKGALVSTVHPPDKMLMGMIFDRMEGRAPLMNPDKKDRRTIADRVSEQGKKRSNKIAESSLEN